MYISGNNSLNDEKNAGMLASERLLVEHQYYRWCLNFFYYMTGDRVDSLTVFKKDGEHDSFQILQQLGNHGNRWIKSELNISTARDFQVMFEGRPGGGTIALDDINLSTGLCSRTYRFVETSTPFMVEMRNAYKTLRKEFPKSSLSF